MNTSPESSILEMVATRTVEFALDVVDYAREEIARPGFIGNVICGLVFVDGIADMIQQERSSFKGICKLAGAVVVGSTKS